MINFDTFSFHLKLIAYGSSEMLYNDGERIYTVVNKKPIDKMQEDEAYIIEIGNTLYVMPYYNEDYTKDETRCGYFRNKISKFPQTEKDKEKHSIRNVYILHPDLMSTELQGYTEEEIVPSGSVTKFKLFKEDDILMKISKDMLNRKNIDPLDYKIRFGEGPSAYNNKIKPIKMDSVHELTLKRFDQLCDIFDVEYKILYRNKKGCQFPMDMGGKEYLEQGRE